MNVYMGMGTMSLMMGAGIGDSSLRLDISWEFKVMLMIISNILIWFILFMYIYMFSLLIKIGIFENIIV